MNCLPDLSDVESTDPAAIYIAEHALNDLTRFTLARDRATDSYQKAFYVIDYDHRRQKVLDTRQWGAAGARASGNSAMLQRLFKQVDGSHFTICVNLDQAKRTNI